MGFCNGISRHRASPSSSVMLRRLKRLRVTAIFYTCGGLCAILLLVNFNEDVKRLLQQSNPPHLSSSGISGGSHSLSLSQQLSPSLQQQPHHTVSSNGRVARFSESKLSEVSSNDVISYNSNIGGREGGSGPDGGKTFDPPATGPNYLLFEEQHEKPWYMWGGTKFPTLSSGVLVTSIDDGKLWYEDNLNNDRILEQLMFWIDDPINNPNGTFWLDGYTTALSTSRTLLKEETGMVMLSETASGIISSSNSLVKTTVDDYFGQSTGGVNTLSQVTISGATMTGVQNDSTATGSRLRNYGNQRRGKLKNILLYYGLGMSWGAHITTGRSVFLQQKCPVNSCRLTGNRAHLSKSDVVVFKDVFMNSKLKRNPSQLWVMYMLECPLNTQNFVDKNVFNLTATYRHDSDIVTPYEKWVYYDENVKTLKQAINYSEGKSKKVAWFVSNCVAKNNRLDYARELSKYIEVDIFGACGTHSCSRANAKQCFDLLAKNYKFYLAFENSNCRDYISEKFFVNGLGNNVLPIVMGAHPDDYKRVAPYKSYIHVDDFASPKELAEHLYLLDANNDLYNEYFQWKGTGEFINTHFFCRLCAMAHYSEKSVRKPRYYKDFNKWWRGAHVCTRRSWRSQPDIFSPEYYESQTTNN